MSELQGQMDMSIEMETVAKPENEWGYDERGNLLADPAGAERRAGSIAAEINAIKAQTRQVMIGAALEIGRKLIEAKAVVPRGRWIAWLEENVDYSERRAQDLMRLYEEYGKKSIPQAIAELDYTKAVALLALPEELRETAAEKAVDEGLSVRELQAEIARLKAENDSRQLKLDDLLKESEEAAAIRARADEAEKALKAANKDLKAAKAQSKADLQRATDAVNRANDAAKELDGLKARVAELEAEPVQVEVVPEDVRAELDRLRGQVKSGGRAECVVKLRVGYERLVNEFKAVEALLRDVEDKAPEEAAKYAEALRRACGMMADKFAAGGMPV